MKCYRCAKDYSEYTFKSGETYLGIDDHHHPPQFMFEEGSWVGKLIPVCRSCHVEIHKEIKQIMFRHSNLFKFVNQEDWLWKHIFGDSRRKCIEEVNNMLEVMDGNSQ